MSQVEEAAADLMKRYVKVVDSRQIEDWPGLFTEDASYRVSPRANVERGLPLSIVCDDSKGRMHDRVTVIRKIWKGNYTEYLPRHLYTVIDVQPVEGAPGEYAVLTNVAIYYTDPDGHSGLLAVGEYQDIVAFEGDTLKFKEKRVILDTEVLPRYFVYPL